MELIILIALIGSIAAGIWDLFTTEVPDEIPVLMVSIGIFYWIINAIITNNFFPLFISLFVGTILLIFGLLMYKKKQWGGADAWVLAAIGYMIPIYAGKIFIIDYLFNFLIISIIYIVVYAFILGIKNRKIFSYFIIDIKENWKIIISIPSIFILIILLFFLFNLDILPLIEMFFLILFIIFFWRYAYVIEKRFFKKRISTAKLKVGDVLEEMKWVGLTKEEVNKIKRQKKFVTIKEGVRFVAVFPITLVVTLLFGNVFFIIL
ncbi:MAG: A24 family peptidase [Candidatus Aenigmatarchaeota archaeon]